MYNLNRFIEAQNKNYNVALNEIKNGKKLTHWIWYIFPQLKELGFSNTSLYYGISSIEEAKEYLKNEYLNNHLIEITEALLNLENKDIVEVLGYPDNLKVKSCMTLFYYASNNEIFKKVIDKFYNGEFDINTIKLIKSTDLM